MEKSASFPRLLTVEQVASKLSVSTKRGYELIARGILPEEAVVRLGRQIRVQEPRLMEWILAGGQAA
ncbi:MAG: helix-turn-helix domain-containing protein [Vulcanimicrobiota bacterium]